MVTNSRGRRVPPLFVVALVLPAMTGFSACHRASQDDAATLEAIAVTAQAARVITLRETVNAAGTIVPTAAADFVVTASEPCSIAELPKNEGDTVQPGEVVARLDVPAVAAELATRQLEFTELSARMETAKAEATRQASLFDKGLAPRNQMEAARTALMTAEANLGQARARLETAKAAEAVTVIRARFAGVVVKRWHNPGDLLTGLETDPILRIVDPGRMQISVPLSTADSGRIVPGQTAEVLNGTGGNEAAIVALKLGATTAGAPTTDVRLNFLVPTTLPIETPVQVSILVNERPGAIVVPADAVQRLDTATFVWMANENSQAVRREVRVGLITNGVAQIANGLAAGELVIVTGIAQLTDGVRVTVTK
jgi:RND family efflux transporter MFP subunit